MLKVKVTSIGNSMGILLPMDFTWNFHYPTYPVTRSTWGWRRN